MFPFTSRSELTSSRFPISFLAKFRMLSSISSLKIILVLAWERSRIISRFHSGATRLAAARSLPIKPTAHLMMPTSATLGCQLSHNLGMTQDLGRGIIELQCTIRLSKLTSRALRKMVNFKRWQARDRFRRPSK